MFHAHPPTGLHQVLCGFMYAIMKLEYLYRIQMEALRHFAGAYACGLCQFGLIAKRLSQVCGLISETDVLLYAVEIRLQAMTRRRIS